MLKKTTRTLYALETMSSFADNSNEIYYARLSVISNHAEIYYAWLCESKQGMFCTGTVFQPFTIEDIDGTLSRHTTPMTFGGIMTTPPAIMELFRWAGAKDEQEYLTSQRPADATAAVSGV
jgi:hypothetical protein